MTADSRVTLRVSRRFAASPERVFDAWLDPRLAGKFLFATPTGRMLRVEIEAQIGGRFVFVDRRDGADIEHVGEYLEIDRPRRLVFTFAVPKFSPEQSRVAIDLAPAGTGCVLTLTHDGVLPDYAKRTEAGWTAILGELARLLGPAPADFGVVAAPGAIRFERLVRGPIERVWAYLTEPDKRGRWLAAGPMEPWVGGAVELHFDHRLLSSATAPPPERYKQVEHGHRMLGRVTRFEPPRLLSYSWQEGAGEASEVTFELAQRGDAVLLVLTHHRLADRAAMIDVAGGWHAHLDVLAERLADREPLAFWTIFGAIDGRYECRIAEI
jgi:uncharacterized protein YndB with AHSA1/START domain